MRVLAIVAVMAAAWLSAADRAAAAGSLTEFVLPTTSSHPRDIAAGADGNLWFTEFGADRIGRITPAGQVTEFPLPGAGTDGPRAAPAGIAAGPDGALWFTEDYRNRLGRITPAGGIREFDAPAGEGIATGPDGNLWYVTGGDEVVRATPAGQVTSFTASLGENAGELQDIAVGSDGNLWFTDGTNDAIGRITPGGSVTAFGAGIPHSASPYGIAAGPDGALWFTQHSQGLIGRIATSGQITEFSVPDSGGEAGITTGPDGALWIAEGTGNAIGRLTTTGGLAELPLEPTPFRDPQGIATGPDGSLWFTEYEAGRIGRLTPAASAPSGGGSGGTSGSGSPGGTSGSGSPGGTGSAGGSGSRPARRHRVAAALRVRGAWISRHRLHVHARLTRRADGDRVRMTVRAAHRHEHFRATVHHGRLRVSRRLRGRLRRAHAALVTYAYGGSARVRPARARLWAPRRPARLRRRTLRLRHGVLAAKGTISSHARGRVVVRLHWRHDGRSGSWRRRARIRHGHWKLVRRLPIRARGGGEVIIRYAGNRRAGVRGEQDAARVRPR